MTLDKMFEELINGRKTAKDKDNVTSDKNKWKVENNSCVWRDNSRFEALDYTETIIYQIYRKLSKSISDKEFELFCECFERYVGRPFNMEMDKECITIMIPEYNRLEDKEEVYCVNGHPIFVMYRHRNFFPNDQIRSAFYLTHRFSYIQLT